MPRRNLFFWAATLAFLTLVLLKFSPETGFTRLIRFGENWAPTRLSALQDASVATVRASNGYDGQFYAQVAIDPLLRNPELAHALDAPAYRARRIAVPIAAFVLGLGRPKWILEAYALVNVACWFGTAWLLARQIKGRSAHDLARWFGCMFSMGVLDSVRQSLVDLPALMLLVLTLGTRDDADNRARCFILSIGNLAKETNILGAIAFYADPQRRLQWRRSLVLLGVTALPLAFWVTYVQHQMQASAGPAGLGNFEWPMAGAARHAAVCLAAITEGDFDGRYIMGLAATLGLGIQSWTIWRQREVNSAWWRVGAAYSVLLVFLGSWVWSGYWAAQRAVLPLTVAFNLLLPASRWFWPTWMLANLTVLHAIWRFL